MLQARQLVVGFLVVFGAIFYSLALTGQAAPSFGGIEDLRYWQESPQVYWTQRREEFFTNTTFKLTKDQLRLLSSNDKYTLRKEAHLPFWFDYELFKKVFGKNYTNQAEELERHLIYIKNCVRTLRARVMFRILAATRDQSINSDADLVSSSYNN